MEIKETEKPHEFEPTDSEGWEMQCVNCSRAVSLFQANDYEKALKEKCNG